VGGDDLIYIAKIGKISIFGTSEDRPFAV